MDWRLLFQFGLPLGHALLLVAVLDATIAGRWVIDGLEKLLYRRDSYYHLDDNKDMRFHEQKIAFAIIPIAFKLLSTLVFLWLGTIFRGSSRMLLAWIVSMILCIIGLTWGIYEWLPIEGQYDLMITLAKLAILFTFSYLTIVGFLSYNSMKSRDYTGTLSPIGIGYKNISSFLYNESQQAAVFVLVLELVIDGYFLLSRDVYVFFEIGDAVNASLPLFTEQFVMRIIRLVVNSIGLFLVLHGRLQIFRIWCVISFILTCLSTVIFLTIFIFGAGHDMFMTHIDNLISFPTHLLFRFVVLYFCIRLTRTLLPTNAVD